MFETTLVASRNAAAIRNPKLLPVAFLVHGLLLTGVVTASYWNVAEVAEPDTYNIIPLSLEPVLPAAEPTPAPAPPPAPTPTAPVTPPVAAAVDVPPTSIDDIPMTPAPIDAPVFQGPATPEVPTNATSGPGCLGCDGPGTGEDGDGVTIVLPGMTPPEALSRVLPTYTEAARRARIQGVVSLEAIIGTDGSVHGARVIKSLPMGLDQQAIDAVLRWKFRPARLGNEPRNVYFTLTVRFELR